MFAAQFLFHQSITHLWGKADTNLKIYEEQPPHVHNQAKRKKAHDSLHAGSITVEEEEMLDGRLKKKVMF